MGSLQDLPKVTERGRAGSFGKNTEERLAMQREVAACGAPMMRGRLLHLPLALPARPETAHEVLVSKARSFEKSPGLRVLLHGLAGHGLFTSEGEHWRRQRKLMAPIFTPAALGQYAEAMRRTAIRSADEMRPGQAIDMAHETMRVAMTVVGSALFGMDAFNEADRRQRKGEEGAALDYVYGMGSYRRALDNMAAGGGSTTQLALVDAATYLKAAVDGDPKTFDDAWTKLAHAAYLGQEASQLQLAADAAAKGASIVAIAVDLEVGSKGSERLAAWEDAGFDAVVVRAAAQGEGHDEVRARIRFLASEDARVH